MSLYGPAHDAASMETLRLLLRTSTISLTMRFLDNQHSVEYFLHQVYKRQDTHSCYTDRILRNWRAWS